MTNTVSARDLGGHRVDDWLVIAEDRHGRQFYLNTEFWPEWGRVGQIPETELPMEEYFVAVERVLEHARGIPGAEWHRIHGASRP